jgi:hypothetical protein
MFDHHAHPGFADDPDVDAMAWPPGSAALRERDTNPELVAAAKALFNYPYNDFSREQADWLVQKKAELRKQHPGTAHFDMILDKLNLEQGVAQPRYDGGLPRSQALRLRFLCDSFMFPFNNERPHKTQSRRAGLHSAPGENAPPLDETGGPHPAPT